ncbi:unnamed protein product [Rotaria sordida]|uniref:FAD-binding PCMH-type domain-containing protein n=1 Tax=Rotaria sordida TaxID=392033 RepID=A0A815KYU0_9BILA|nr:unnamed protein product [Rotaria sordida]
MSIRVSYTFFFAIVVLNEHLIITERSCRCLSSDSICWPNSSVWQTFNQSIDGRLVLPLPSAAVCHSTPVNLDACNTAITNWSNSSWRSDQVGAMQNFNWENSSCSVFIGNSSCSQGSVSTLAVNATLPEHVQATVKIASTYNLRLVIKTTGHDYLGRSAANGSFLLWLHYMKNMTLIDQFTACGDTVSNAIRLSAGVQWGEAYAWLNQFNLTAVGGAYATVGAAGGYLQGGGHGPLSRWKGLAADNVLEFDVVTADGRRKTVNACQNPHLFWALRGGGGGTFAVVLNVVLRTFPSPPVIAVILDMIPPNETRYNNFINDFVYFLPTLSDRNCVNPVWRTALIHMVYAVGWPDLTSEEEQQAIAKHVTSQVKILQEVAGGDRSGCYMNEADPNEPNWQQKFFGKQAIYDRLKSIKNSVDPFGLFVCRNCVGSDDWSSDLNCPKT